MKKNLILFVFMASALFALNSCKKEFLVEVNGIVQGTVLDDFNNPLKNANVSLDGGVSKTTTDSLGYYKIAGIAPGQHFVVFSKAGYSVIRSSFSINSPNEVANTTSGQKQSYDYYAVVNSTLSGLNGKIKGYVYYNNIALANAKVTVFLESSYEPNVYTVSTNDVGAYNFNNLPVHTSLTVVAIHPTEPGTEGSATIYAYSSGSTTADGVLLVDNISVTTEPLKFVSGDYFKFENGTLVNKGIDTTANIILTFSDAVSQVITQNKKGFVELYDANDKLVGATVTYNGNRITIDPANNLTHYSGYYVSFKVYSTESKYISNSGSTTQVKYNFTTKPRPVAALSGKPAITIVSNALHLSAATTNAKRYDVYASVDGKLEFVEIADEITLATNYSVSTYAAGAQFYIVPVTYDEDGVRTYGTASDVITK